MDTHPLTRHRVREVVSKGQSGFYRLGYILDERFQTTYVGRSDTCLRRRLLDHVRERWQERFIVRPTLSRKEAYRLECLFYHLERAELGNKIHPGKPAGIETECPYCKQETAIANNPPTNTTNNAD
jgi:hypothetical protein